MEDDAGDERARIERRFQTDINKCLRAKTTYITDASSEEQSEILSRRKRLSLWLQSNKYEMIIGLALCVNVLWMALELQVHGQETGLATACLVFCSVWEASFGARAKHERKMYFGTSSRCFLTMFEILFANWAPSCRVLVESVSEWFSVFFLVYRCILGFAVLNVVNAVFVQQTMKTASSDEELAFRQKEKDGSLRKSAGGKATGWDIAQYMRKVKRLFQTMDASGDGAINLDEFSKLVKSPKLKLTRLMDFVEGASRLRGSAKALDIWRIETKIEARVKFGAWEIDGAMMHNATHCIGAVKPNQ
eukprot:Skav205942  [mRNA]  locus=scaffold442:26363:34325:+ [translate_table: standard]